MVTLFVVFLILAAYSYLIYPCLLYVLSRIICRDWARKEITPSISIIISAYNEEQIIAQKLQNALALDYPEGQLQVIVSSDGSTDRTNEIVSAMKDPRLTLFAFSEREGKTACLNRVVPQARGEIVLFTDANSMFPPHLLRELSRNFADPEIGLVTGWTKYLKAEGSEETTSLYSRFEKWSKVRESLVSSCVGADGAVFAIRKELYSPLEDYDINDFVIPLNVIRQGKRAVLDPGVFCHEEPSEGTGKEYQRQVRITTRTLGAIWRNMEFLNPMKYGSFSFLLFSHKVMRFQVPYFVIGAMFVNLLILNHGNLLVALFALQLAFVIWGIICWLFALEGGVNGILKFLVTTFAAQAIGWIRMTIGIKDTTWKPQR